MNHVSRDRHIGPPVGESVTGYRDVIELMGDIEQEMLIRMQAHASSMEQEGAEADLECADGLARRRRARIRVSEAIPWRSIVGGWGLDELEQEVLAYLLGLREGFRIKRYVREADVDRWDTVHAILGVLCATYEQMIEGRRAFRRDGRLMRKGIIGMHGPYKNDSLLDEVVWLNAEAVAGLMDDDHSMSHLSRGIQVLHPTESLEQVVLAPESAEIIDGISRDIEKYRLGLQDSGLEERIAYGLGTILLFEGPPGTGKTLAARAMAGQMGRPLITLDLASVIEGRRMEPEETLRVAIVEVHRRDGILFLDEFDMLLEEASTYGRQDDFLTLLETVDGIVVLATNRGARLPQALDRRILHRLCFKPPNRGEREEIWRLLMPPGCHPTGGELQRLASFPITGGYIKNSILYALQRATTLDEPIGFEHLLESARESRRRMSHAIREHTSVSMLYDENACEHLVVTPAMEACLEQFRKLEQPSITAARELVADRGLRIWLRTSDLDLARRIALWLGRRLHMPCIVPDRHLVERSLPDDSVSHALFDQWAGRSIMLIRTHTNQRDIYGESLRKQLSGWVRDAGIHVIMAGIPPDEDLQEWAGLFHRIITMEERGSASLEYLESLVARSGLRLSDEAVALLYRRRPCTHEQRCVFLRLIEESTGPEVSGELMAGVLEEVSLKPRNEGRLFGAEKRRG